MKKIFFIPLFSFLSFLAFAHGGEDHGSTKAAIPTGLKYFSSEALSDKYEVLVKYGELDPNKESIFQLFLSDARTNRAIDSATLVVRILNQPNLAITLSRVDTGIYQVKGIFPENGIYDMQVNITGMHGADLLQVSKIEVGKKLVTAEDASHSHWYDNSWLWAIVGLIAGLVVMYLIMRNRNRKIAAAAMLVALLIPTAVMNPTSAHEGEDHGAGAAKSSGLSNSFVVEKESQFLFDILTEKTGAGNFYQSTEILGTVTAAPQGRAVIQTPQTGKIVALRVTPGQSVAQGATLAIIEQQVEAGTQLDIISQRNTLNAEVKAAKAQYDRLKSIEDIAAKKDVTEAKARYEAAVQNLQLFNANVGRNMGSTKMVSLTAPISGVVGTFNYAIGAVVNTGETLFEITNLNKVFVEAQVFVNELSNEGKNSRFVAFSNYDTVAHPMRMVSTALAVNTENQSQRIVFEIVNPAGKFKIGENVRVLRYGSNRIEQLVIPTAAIIDINGKPAVFIKDKAEQFSVSFIQKGESNAIYTAIVKGVEGGERVITENVYQMKMIYLNQ
jgi:membrane fusion protein, heavy metal efflux system